MTTLLAIDPGSERSAWLRYREGRPDGCGIEDNVNVLERCRFFPLRVIAAIDVVVIEQVESYGMPVGKEVFDTVRWSGRFEEAVSRSGIPVVYLPRRQVKAHLCRNPRATDANVRAALLERYGGQAATRKGGPLHGVVKDLWSALAVATVFAETVEAAA